jgi:hypothetical protein
MTAEKDVERNIESEHLTQTLTTRSQETARITSAKKQSLDILYTKNKLLTVTRSQLPLTTIQDTTCKILCIMEQNVWRSSG